MKKILMVLILWVVMGLHTGCSITLNGASIPPEMKTIDVEYFENNSLYVINNLSQQFTEALKERIRSQTRLSIVRTPEADATFSGVITNTSIAPVSIQATGNSNAPPIANASRLSITVKVKYTNQANKKLDFEQDFTQTADFAGDIASQQQNLILTINKRLTEDIFNKAFADW